MGRLPTPLRAAARRMRTLATSLTLRKGQHSSWFAYAPMSGATYNPRTAAATVHGIEKDLPEPEVGLPDSARSLLESLISAAPPGHPGRDALLAQLDSVSAAREPHWESAVVPDVVPHLHLFFPSLHPRDDTSRTGDRTPGDGVDPGRSVERVVPHQQTWPVHGRTEIAGIPTHVELQIVDGLLNVLALYPQQPEDDPDGYDEELHRQFESVARELTAWPDPAAVSWEVEGTSSHGR